MTPDGAVALRFVDLRLEGDRLMAFADLRTRAVLESVDGVEVAALAIIETPAAWNEWRVEAGNVIPLADVVVGATGFAYLVLELSPQGDIVDDWFATTLEGARDIAMSVYSDAPWEDLPDPPEALSAIKKRLGL
jgi:hypothetical protein